MPSNDYISQMVAAIGTDVGGTTSRLEMTKAFATAPLTLAVTPAVLRTAMFAGAGTYTATDPINAGAAGFTTVAASVGVTVAQGTIAAQAAGYAQTVTWNNVADTFLAHTLDVTDTSSTAGSLLARWRVGGVDKFVVSKAGALTAGAASFTTLAASGTSALTGNVGIGGASAANVGLKIQSAALTGTSQSAAQVVSVFSAAATSATVGFYIATSSDAAAYTTTNAYGILIDALAKGAGSTITNAYGLFIENQTVGGTLNYAIKTGTGLVSFGDAVTSTGNLTVGASTFVVTAATGGFVSTGSGIFKGGVPAHQTSAVTIAQDSATESQMRCYGPDAATPGTFSIHLMASDGAPDVTALSFLATGAGTFGSTLKSTGDFTVGASTFVVTAATGAVSALGVFSVGNASANTTIQQAGLNTTEFYQTAGSAAATFSIVANVGYLKMTTAHTLILGTNNTANITIASGGALKLSAQPAFVAGSKYLVIDASGNVQVSAVGPAS